jgi:hypothetical protein
MMRELEDAFWSALARLNRFGDGFRKIRGFLGAGRLELLDFFWSVCLERLVVPTYPVDGCLLGPDGSGHVSSLEDPAQGR